MITVKRKHILQYKIWDYDNKPTADFAEEGYDVEMFKSAEKVAGRIKGLLGNKRDGANVYIQLFSGTIPDKGDLLDRAILLSWNPTSEIIQLTLPFSTVFIKRQNDSDKYDWFVKQLRLRITDFHAQLSRNPHWLTYLNDRAFIGASIK